MGDCLSEWKNDGSVKITPITPDGNSSKTGQEMERQIEAQTGSQIQFKVGQGREG
jgi:hypothetical protein